ncbi:hypothetical protein [Streptomyces sp. NPDC001194]|uniref:hypothetical protein n=1 Tax=Streptomyces sp. NPDC001194 TaxID=3364547 RepID=UPI0036C5E476
MTLTPAEAREQANKQLAALYAGVTDWTEATYDQAIAAIASDNQPFSMNDIRIVFPGSEHHQAGLYFHSLLLTRSPQLLIRVGDVTSINEKAHGKRVNTYRLTVTGSKFLEIRRDARAAKNRREQARAARRGAA